MNRRAAGAEAADRDSNGFAEATFDAHGGASTSSNRQARQHVTASAGQSPLYAPQFPTAAEHRRGITGVVGGTGAEYAALPLNSPADSAVVEMSASRRAGPLKALPTALQPDRFSSSADAEKPAGGEIKQTAAQTDATNTSAVEDPDQWYQAQIDYVRTQVEQMDNVEVQRGQEAESIRTAWKRRLFLLFEDPASSPSAFVINVVVTFMIIFSAVLTTVETIPALRKGREQLWLGFEVAIVAIFTVEFVLRFLGHTDTWQQAWRHTKSAVTIIDALAIFPFYVEVVLRRDTSYEFRFTILRIFRLLRVFSAFKYSSLLQLSIEVMIVAIKRSADALLAFLVFVTLTVLLFSTLMYFAERGVWDVEREAFLTANGEYSKFSSIPAAAYYAIVTLTTTGFGDMVPTTVIGKLVSFPMMIAGILLIALPSIIVGRNFTQVWEAARKLRGPRTPRHAAQSDQDDAASDIASESRRSHWSLRRRRRSHRTLRRPRRSGSISSFESVSSKPPRSVREAAGGYVHVSGGQDAANDAATAYPHSADPLDALARKDSIEMQRIATRTQPGPDGYTHVETLYSDSARHDPSDDAEGSSRREGPSAWRSPRLRTKGKARAPSEAHTDAVAVSRHEWEAINTELVSLRSAFESNHQLLQAIAASLSIPAVPPISGAPSDEPRI
ncbi:voltage-gated potassium channel [Coemansia reversa NRRL 1564]|uniref:Voltage-gated potassium channel n=1 Tax=Coemansia reversa (strain ATCC 12441 / NRRL 1564) TaxID=763665 RepID=A0A2G5BH14_COERN|nr:voltage-gated potassium channel [Coemansia reversa NRRL 1564]|eukprot:PIA18309.1 voltage-gated potassium channel [Coemansia reversa NRRL 1564]